jgi:hypothetical protein
VWRDYNTRRESGTDCCSREIRSIVRGSRDRPLLPEPYFGTNPCRRPIPKRKVWLDCGKYLLRTVTVEDATDRWAKWMADPEASLMLNAAPRAMTKSDIVAYIKGFDQRTKILIGIFRKVERTAARFSAQRCQF